MYRVRMPFFGKMQVRKPKRPCRAEGCRSLCLDWQIEPVRTRDGSGEVREREPRPDSGEEPLTAEYWQQDGSLSPEAVPMVLP